MTICITIRTKHKKRKKFVKRKFCHCNQTLAAGILALAVIPLISHAATSTNAGYTHLYIAADTASVASHQDSRLVNPWGIVASASTVWVNDNGPGLMTAYGGTGNPSKTVANIPAPGGGSVYQKTRLTLKMAVHAASR